MLPRCGCTAWPAWGASFAAVVPRPQGDPRRPRRVLGRLRGRAGRSRAGRGGDPGRFLQLPAAGLAALQPPPPAPSAPRAPRPARPRRGHTLSSPRPPGPALCGARGRARPPYLWLRVALGSEVGAAGGADRSESLRTGRAGGSTLEAPGLRGSGLRASGGLSWSGKGTRAGAARDTSAKAAASAGGKRAVCCLHLRAAHGVRRPP